MAKKPIVTGLIVAAALLGASLLVKMSEHAGLITGDLAERTTLAILGLMVAYYGNQIPKNIGRSRGVENDRRLQTVLRASGWSFAVAGLAYAGISLFAPAPTTADMLAIVAAIIITAVFAARCLLAGRSRTQ